MSRPTRADEVRMTSTQASRKKPPRQATMTTLDLEDSNVRPDAWFVYVMPIQSGVEMMGSGRYGFWDERPDVYLDDNCVRVVGKYDDDPIFVAPKASTVSVHVAKARHIEATPFPVAKTEQGDS